MIARKIVIASLWLLLGGIFGYLARPKPSPEQDAPSLSVATQAISEPVDVLTESLATLPTEALAAELLAHREDPLVYRFVATRWASTDPLGLFAFIETFDWRAKENVALLDDLFTILYREWGRADPEAAFAHAFEHPWAERGERYFGLERLVDVVAETDLDQAVDMILRAPSRVNAFRPGPWIAKEPRTLLPKLARLPELSSWRIKAMQRVYSDCTDEDPKAALSYFRAQPYGDPFHGNGIAMATAIIGEDPEAAISWAASQKNPAIQLVVQAAANAAESRPKEE